MSVVSITVPSIGFPPAAGASKLIDLTDVEAGAAGSKIGQFLTELAPVSGARRFGFMAAAGGLKVADWDASGAALPLDPAAIGGTLATIDGIATVAPFNPVPVMAGAAIFYGLTMPIGLPAASAALDLIWPLLPTDAPSFVFTLLHDQSADLSALVEAVLTNSAAGVSGLIAGLQSGNEFGFTLPSNDSFPLTLPELGSSILLTINNDGSLVFGGFGGFGDNILTDSAAANGYAISYLMVVMGVSESLPPLSVNIGTSDLSGGYGAAELPDNVSDLDTIYRVTNGGIYAGQTLNQNDHVIFYNDQADFLIIRLPADFNPDDFTDLIDNAISASVQAGGVVDGAIGNKINASLENGGAIYLKLQEYKKIYYLFLKNNVLPAFLSKNTDYSLRLLFNGGNVEIAGRIRKVLDAAQAGVDILIFSLPLYPDPAVNKFTMYSGFAIDKTLSVDVLAVISDIEETNLIINISKGFNSDVIEIRLKGDIGAGQGNIYLSAPLGLGFIA